MPTLDADALARLVASVCTICRDRVVRARALASGTIALLDGEPVSAVAWSGPPEAAPERIYRVECVGCGAAPFERSDCPVCRSAGGLARALSGRNGLSVEKGTLPRSCPRCGLGDLRASAEVRMHILYVEGYLSRRVADAELHDLAFQVTEVACPDCEAVIASAPAMRCAACGRSSLLKRPG
ncbi:MAG: hypothetical protein EXR72_00370 [Myxococcales bacterium]|nr:hypothetical protein [Myxococcales bacterium]